MCLEYLEARHCDPMFYVAAKTVRIEMWPWKTRKETGLRCVKRKLSDVLANYKERNYLHKERVKTMCLEDSEVTTDTVSGFKIRMGQIYPVCTSSTYSIRLHPPEFFSPPTSQNKFTNHLICKNT